MPLFRTKCSLPSCTKLAHVAGLCGMHYMRQKRYGSVDVVHPRGGKKNYRLNIYRACFPNRSPSSISHISRAHKVLVACGAASASIDEFARAVGKDVNAAELVRRSVSTLTNLLMEKIPSFKRANPSHMDYEINHDAWPRQLPSELMGKGIRLWECGLNALLETIETSPLI